MRCTWTPQEVRQSWETEEHVGLSLNRRFVDSIRVSGLTLLGRRSGGCLTTSPQLLRQPLHDTAELTAQASAAQTLSARLHGVVSVNLTVRHLFVCSITELHPSGLWALTAAGGSETRMLFCVYLCAIVSSSISYLTLVTCCISGFSGFMAAVDFSIMSGSNS